MKKIGYLLLMLLFVVSCGKKTEEKSTTSESNGEKTYKIGITQIVSHPVLDSTRQGFEDAFKEAGLKVEFDEQNAQGEIPTANVIANKFVTDKVDLIFSIATPTTQAVVNATSTIPVVFSAVTDPQSAGLLKENVTGSSDRVDNVGEQLDILKELNPNAKTIGILFSSSEQNSITQVEAIKKVAAEKGIEVVEQSVTSASEITQALSNLLPKVDALYIPTDNLVVSNMPAVVERANAAKKIVIATDEGSVATGALYTKGIDFYDLGKEAGKLAIQILKDGKKPSELKYVTLKPTNLVFNKKSLEAIGLTIPESLKAQVKFIDQK
ncbi:MAG: ABC transporter substrate-binding protein [Sebaldella sp.]|nr:ABC transporter substrate-binding protein [Sebaldella sp.]